MTVITVDEREVSQVKRRVITICCLNHHRIISALRITPSEEPDTLCLDSHEAGAV